MRKESKESRYTVIPIYRYTDIPIYRYTVIPKSLKSKGALQMLILNSGGLQIRPNDALKSKA